MRTTIEFFVEVANGHNPNRVAVLVAKHGNGAFFFGVFDRHFFPSDRQSAPDLSVDDFFNLFELFRGDLAKVGEVKP